MKTYPPVPPVEDAPADLFEGHLWIQEKVDGAHLRFRLTDAGVLRFGTRDGRLDAADVPPGYRHAVRHVRERLDREALRAAVGDVGSVVFFGEATRRETLEYDWARLPSYLGFDVWDGARGRFLPPDAVERTLRELGLDPVNAFEKEVDGAYFDPEAYAIPDSAWRDGPPEGVVIRSKTGERAQLRHPAFDPDSDPDPDPDPGPGDPDEVAPSELARRHATADRVERVAAALRDGGRGVTFDALFERVLDAAYRVAHRQLPDDPESRQAFRSEVAALTRAHLDGGG
ncbi:MAG: RNA ligase family protein [Halobacteriaceae archaeon]